MTWIVLARDRTAPRDAARIMQCNTETARRRLAQAVIEMSERRHNIQEAERVILADGIVRQEISRHAWEEVALGIRRTAAAAAATV